MTTVVNSERNRQLAPTSIRKLAAAYGVDPHEIIAESEKIGPPPGPGPGRGVATPPQRFLEDARRAEVLAEESPHVLRGELEKVNPSGRVFAANYVSQLEEGPER